MGKVRPLFVKRVARRLLTENPGKFKYDFAHNKRVVEELVDVPTKRMRNRIAGYLTRLMRGSE